MPLSSCELEMIENSPSDFDQRYLEALKALIAPGLYGARLETSPLIELPIVLERTRPGASPAERAGRFIKILEGAVSDRLRMNDQRAAQILFALEKWTGTPAHNRRDAVAKLRDK